MRRRRGGGMASSHFCFLYELREQWKADFLFFVPVDDESWRLKSGGARV